MSESGVLSRRRRVALAWGVLAVFAGVGIYLFRLDPMLWTIWGDRQLRQQDYVSAELSYQRALDIDPDHGPALYGLGWAYLLAGLTDQAQQRFQAAVDVAPGYFGGYRGLAATARAAGEPDKAEQHLRRALELAPEEAGVLADLAALYCDAGHHDECLDLFERAAGAAPRRAEFRLGQAEACLAAGHLEEGRRHIEEANDLAVRDSRFLGAVDQLRAVASIVELELELRNPGADVPCERYEALLDDARGHLSTAEDQGLELVIAVEVRRRIEGNRLDVEMVCAPQSEEK